MDRTSGVWGFHGHCLNTGLDSEDGGGMRGALSEAPIT